MNDHDSTIANDSSKPLSIQPGRRYKTRSGLTVTIACLSVTSYEGSIEGVYRCYQWRQDGRFIREDNVAVPGLDLVEEVVLGDHLVAADTSKPAQTPQHDPFEPDWDMAAPEWMWHAHDADGTGWFYEHKPDMAEDRWLCSVPTDGYLCCERSEGCPDWRDSLRQRPTAMDASEPAQTPQHDPIVIAGKTFALTGQPPLGITREAVVSIIERAGGHVSKTVTKKTDYLIAGENPGSKLNKAQAFGVRVVDYDEMSTILLNAAYENLRATIEQQPQEQDDPFEPDWDSVPEGYHWAAVDHDGDQFCYKEKPRRGSLYYFVDGEPPNPWHYVRTIDLDNLDWKQSLRQRPTALDASEPAVPQHDPFEPDWDSVPRGWMWHAYDKSGRAYYYASKPTLVTNRWECTRQIDKHFDCERSEGCPDWHISLRKRPGSN